MKQVCKINKERDLGYTIPDLAIDIEEAITTGVIKQTPVNISSYNMMSDTDQIGQVVTNVFDAIDAQNQINQQMSTQNE